MSYQALYRVWRPQRFSDVVGQQLVVTTLKNAIITNQISHAYLFAGPRGTGKTSAAKIFAKAVNCHHKVDGEPCNQCDICQEITKGQLGDVIEIDAASNNGVEEIRDIRDKARYAPTRADYKVYIIDEVHMLSTGAFNALLKTLEEPPANVIFILATTEPHKIPLTIISRVQRFDFRRISAKDAFERMKYILDQKGLDYDDQALWVIANAAEGGMRDALSILDQALSFSDNRVELDDALLVTGSVTKQLLKQYFLQVAGGESAAALKTLSEVLGQGKDGQRFIEDLIAFIRDLLLYQESPKLVAVETTGLTEEDFATLAQAKDAQGLYSMIDTLNEVQEEMRFTTHPDVYLEVLTVRLSQQPAANGGAAAAEVAALQSQVAKLTAQVQALQQRPAVAAPSAPKPAAPKRAAGNGSGRVNLEHVYQVLDHATQADFKRLQEVWPATLEKLSGGQQALINQATLKAASPAGVVLAYPKEQSFLIAKAQEINSAVAAALTELTGTERRVVVMPAEQWEQTRQDYMHSERFQRNWGQGGQAASGATAKEAPAATSAATSDTASQPAPQPEQTASPAEPASASAPQSSTGDQLIDAAEQLFGQDGITIENN